MNPKASKVDSECASIEATIVLRIGLRMSMQSAGKVVVQGREYNDGRWTVSAHWELSNGDIEAEWAATKRSKVLSFRQLLTMIPE